MLWGQGEGSVGVGGVCVSMSQWGNWCLQVGVWGLQVRPESLRGLMVVGFRHEEVGCLLVVYDGCSLLVIVLNPFKF